MVAAAHRHGVPVLVDGAQAVPHMPANVQEMGADFYVFSGHKIFAPMGVGALYGRKEMLEDMPPWQGGGSMIRDVTFERTSLRRSARQVRGRHADRRRRRRASARRSSTSSASASRTSPPTSTSS